MYVVTCTFFPVPFLFYFFLPTLGGGGGEFNKGKKLWKQKSPPPLPENRKTEQGPLVSDGETSFLFFIFLWVEVMSVKIKGMN